MTRWVHCRGATDAITKRPIGSFSWFLTMPCWPSSACDWYFLLHVLVGAHRVRLSLHLWSPAYYVLDWAGRGCVSCEWDCDCACVLSSHHSASTIEEGKDGWWGATVQARTEVHNSTYGVHTCIYICTYIVLSIHGAFIYAELITYGIRSTEYWKDWLYIIRVDVVEDLRAIRY